MTEILLEVQGADAITATEGLLAIPAIIGKWEAEEENERGTIPTKTTTIRIF